jgi:hypothetical protein
MAVAPAANAVSYGPARVRLSVLGKYGQNAGETYKDLFRHVTGEEYVCIVCEKLAALGGPPSKLLKMSQSDNFGSHVARCCPQELTEVDINKEVFKKAAKAWAQKKPEVRDWHFKPKLAAIDDLAAELALFCLTDGRPFSMVEDVGFKKLWDVMRPGEILPSVSTVLRRAALLDEAWQRDFIRTLLPMHLGYSDSEEAVVPADTPYTLYSTTTDAWQSNAGGSANRVRGVRGGLRL